MWFRDIGSVPRSPLNSRCVGIAISTHGFGAVFRPGGVVLAAGQHADDEPLAAEGFRECAADRGHHTTPAPGKEVNADSRQQPAHRRRGGIFLRPGTDHPDDRQTKERRPVNFVHGWGLFT